LGEGAFLLDQFGQSEVGQVGFVLGVEQDIAGFDVSR
jgi:hypothetical protein